MTSTVAIGYYNAAGFAQENVGSFEAAAPLSNILTPRLGQKAIMTDFYAGGCGIRVYVSGASPSLFCKVGIISILNTNIVALSSPSDISITINTSDGDIYSSVLSDNPPTLISGFRDGTFQSHITWVPSFPGNPLASKTVEFISVFISNTATVGRLNPYTGEVTAEQLFIGAVWMGPSFSPRNGIAIGGFEQSIIDTSQVVRSIGGQVWAEPEVRQRAAKIRFAGLFEDEVYGIAPAQSLQQLAAYCGVSRPLIVIPTTSDDELMYAQGIYGYLSSPASWSLIERAREDGELKRLYDGSLEIVEAR